MDAWNGGLHSVKLDTLAALIRYHQSMNNARAARRVKGSCPVAVEENPESRIVEVPEGLGPDKIVVFLAFPKNFGYIQAVSHLLFLPNFTDRFQGSCT